MEIPRIILEDTEGYVYLFDKGEIWRKYKNYTDENGVIIRNTIHYRKCGSKSVDGYINIKVYGKSYRLHRILFEKYYNVILTETDIIDHINHDPSNNRITNLRLTDIKGNNQN